MNNTLFCGGVLLAAGLFCAGFALYCRRRLRRTLDALDRLVDAALRGDFTESRFDESLQSSVEAKLAHYLAASEVSARNLAEEKDKIKELIGDISHQTKTPLANILLYSQLLREQPLPPAAQGCVEPLNAQAEKLRFLIDALVKTSRLETGVLALHPVQAPVADLLDAVLLQARPLADAKQITLRAEPTKAAACFDPKWTAEALYNLVDNAIKYTPCGGSVAVEAARYELFCRITVTDTGCGIAEEEQAKIFTRFYRGVAAAQQPGVGIGLYLTRQIAAAEGGYLKVASAPGQGAAFSLFVPTGG